MRKVVAGMQMSIDGMIDEPDGYTDWVDSWSDTFDLLPEIDACVLGSGMYTGYEQYWSAIKRDPHAPLEFTGKAPTQEEIEYADFALRTPHYVLTKIRADVQWANASIVREVEGIERLRRQPGRSIYVVGGARTVSSLMDHGLIDELRLTIHPLVVGQGKALFDTVSQRHYVHLEDVKRMDDGRVCLIYKVGDRS
ncbi:dihydrofolate reductase family protein [Ensifer adhaerens]|uniref:dihydrofolate reductase family protein n=1 Tax=Ensifer adhaerens TaxID=106592 RepID=UPI001CBE5E10|nr:dihydrofolate reductase family protein [Ensifer adhaerens]MBZ7920810.1 dihydrofolate reductase family protein [Ensifer adhaerens]UAX93264.1 dihydrofolate reductase family protein [Ensifer adhaerens]UAY00901.1 dihydrofolate reductase family protein [Ensifer adhaerens]UAY08282.1 dihydrofolate reductase family protein [Ensifer adhaerens]